jgi:uncharacterized protein YllA (UPF0747 family)
MSAVPASWPLASRTAGPLWRDGAREPLPAPLLDRWRREAVRWPAPVTDALERLADPAVPVIATGQQPGPWGGPLYNLYKAATAAALAERAGGVAIFWVQGDDADWGEIGWGTLPRPDLSVWTHRWEPAVPSRHWVGSGRIAFPGDAQAVFEGWGRSGPLLGRPRDGEPAEIAGGFIETLLAWFGNAGLVPLDARWPELREAGAPLWTRYAREHGALARGIGERGEALAAAGRPVTFTGDATERGLFVLEGEARLDPDPDRWESAVRERLDAGRFGELAPSVLLRSLLQDRLFGSAAHVVGGAESAYLEQLAPVYEAFATPPPVRVPRLRAVLVPRGLLDPADRAAAIADPEAWLAGRARHHLDTRATAAVQSARDAVNRALESLAVEADGPRDLGDVAESARRKVDRELARVDEVLARRARQALYRDEPRFRNLPEFLRPRRGDQERGLSGASAALLLGDAAPERLLEAARRHLDRLEAGAWDLFYLEGA